MRITRLDRSQVDDKTAVVYDDLMRVRGNVPNMFRTVAHNPEIMRTMTAHLNSVMQSGTVPRRLKQLLVVRTSQINRSHY